uniref:Uncharacterized protein n=1 Tax=Arundo donax TaxID=35708 RepID=A0A0A8ZQC4_ARUDO
MLKINVQQFILSSKTNMINKHQQINHSNHYEHKQHLISK